ncbi:uncharacterized protein FOMMEDRAFT_79617 [Fomitiporia mediterranea MF3/22]|uniref:uncharacterized protein n=1 Tax=Fomitiporia mediterranea (strain MF3/22) TaxID=694068 RepID=UPI00044098E6|nr:uncharacterized protein FOMMEDRAFT_79617 [Fomitiporia mediterranea MF3/22]EJD06086.1 hypothetical protein FOMMEDRAFT_79617 [Fomitiporia mediterranea MF3/22]
MPAEIYNANPTVFTTSKPSKSSLSSHSLWIDDVDASDNSDDDEVEPIDSDEIFEHIRGILDPEHPLTLEQLAVVSAGQVDIKGNNVFVEFTPTVPHCGASTLIGLSIRVRLMRTLPHRFKVDIRVKPGSHQSESALNKQLNDKERVAAALENNALLNVVEQCLKSPTQ